MRSSLIGKDVNGTSMDVVNSDSSRHEGYKYQLVRPVNVARKWVGPRGKSADLAQILECTSDRPE